MEKTALMGSVDDLVGGAIWRLGGAGGNGSASNFHRTDSEAAFQDFLKRIPSANNLNNLDSTQLSSLAGRGGASTGSLLLNATSIPAPPNMDVLGIPRVPSLDFLRQLASNQNQNGAKMEQNAMQNAMPFLSPMLLHPGLMMSDLASMSAATNAAALTASALTASALQAMPNLSMLQASMAHTNANQAPSMREAMVKDKPSAAKGRPQKEKAPVTTRVVKRPHQYSGNGSDDGTMSGSDDSGGEGGQEGKGGDRRARRMLSNRESARRSRRRKQEHLANLEQEIHALNEEKEDLMNQILTLQSQVAEVPSLRAEIEELKEKLKSAGHS